MAADIILITGGQRSGKSSYAQKLAEAKSANPVYLATARIWDEDFRKRIDRHKADRGPHWNNLEEEKQLSRFDLAKKVVVLDCITLWLTNMFHDSDYDLETTLNKAKSEWGRFANQDFTLIVVSNEIGMGVHAEHESARKFADLQGWMNQHIARTANEVILMVAGIPLIVKGQ